jgi:hypothetical protein
MCVTPQEIYGSTLVSCRKCWQCRKNRVNDLVGRCIAEEKHSTKTYAVTLTYAGDTVNATTLIYSDVQNFMKRLRSAGYDVRYIVAGEYGDFKQRAHWHIVLFFTGKVPKVETDARIDFKYWKHGFSYWQEPSWKSLAYVMKYALKSLKDGEVNLPLKMSKLPPLGHYYLQDLAAHYVDKGLAPDRPYYSFPEVRNANGKIIQFYLSGKSLENFIERFLELYNIRHGREFMGHSEIIEKYDRRTVAKEIKQRSVVHFFDDIQRKSERRMNKHG